MSGKGDDQQMLCGTCHGPAHSNAKLHLCNNCNKYFHCTCVKLAAVTIDNKAGKACRECISRANPSLNAPSRSRTTSNSSMSDASDVAVPTNSILKSILNEITGLKTSMDNRFDKVGLEDVKHELAEMKLKLDNHVESSTDSSASTNPALLGKILNLEKQNAEMSTSLATVSTLRLSISTDLAVSVLTWTDECDLKLFATAVFASAHPDIEEWDIVAVRPPIRKARGAITGTLSDPTTTASAILLVNQLRCWSQYLQERI